jgi:hypothetical protein
MAAEKKVKKQSEDSNRQESLLWREPITLDVVEEQDPLTLLYQGSGQRENTKVKEQGKRALKVDDPYIEKSNKTDRSEVLSLPHQVSVEKTAEPVRLEPEQKQENERLSNSRKITEAELKNILKIKGESFHFTDIREILRGKSIDIYAYLRFLSASSGVCKIKHLDLMRKLEISRPTLFKQAEWLTRLCLIEKRSVPGDHLGTTYRIFPVEEVLPLPEAVADQLESYIVKFEQT